MLASPHTSDRDSYIELNNSSSGMYGLRDTQQGISLNKACIINGAEHCKIPSLAQLQQHPLRHVPGFDEFKYGYGKSSSLTVINNYTPRGSGLSLNLMLDPICLTKFQNGHHDQIQLRPILGYYCCYHVIYCPFTCNDKNFLKLAVPPEIGRSLNGYPCPFNDGGSAEYSRADFGDSADSKRFLKLT